MTETPENQNANEPAAPGPKILAGYLASALDMEDRVSNSIYRDYLLRENWPKNLKPEIFQNIRQYLNVLIEDTEKHRKTILSIIEKYEQDEQSK
jgi:hypothetical protein